MRGRRVLRVPQRGAPPLQPPGPGLRSRLPSAPTLGQRPPLSRRPVKELVEGKFSRGQRSARWRPRMTMEGLQRKRASNRSSGWKAVVAAYPPADGLERRPVSLTQPRPDQRWMFFFTPRPTPFERGKCLTRAPSKI